MHDILHRFVTTSEAQKKDIHEIANQFSVQISHLKGHLNIKEIKSPFSGSERYLLKASQKLQSKSPAKLYQNIS